MNVTKVSSPVTSPGPLSMTALERARFDFPILRQSVHGRPLVYLDSAATTQKPRQVIDAIVRYYEESNANVHRGVHLLSERATEAFEGARDQVQRFLNARSRREIIFTRGTTESVNLVAQTYGRVHVGPGDEVLITALEHHSNLVPWQLLCEQRGASLQVVPMNDRGELELAELDRLLGPKTRLFAVTHVSNSLGTVNDIRALVAMAHQKGVPVLVDGAQAVSHLPVDVQALGCDFYAFSSHKLYGPTGIGVLYGKEELLAAMPPYQGGGDMILSVAYDKTVFNALPYRFEAGTPDIAGAAGLSAALDYVEELGRARIAEHEAELLEYGTQALQAVPGLRLIGTARQKVSILSFTLEGVHPHDIGSILDQRGVAIRTGHHCAQPVMRRFGVEATARASLALYNTHEDLDTLVEGLLEVREVLGHE